MLTPKRIVVSLPISNKCITHVYRKGIQLFGWISAIHPDSSEHHPHFRTQWNKFLPDCLVLLSCFRSSLSGSGWSCAWLAICLPCAYPAALVRGLLPASLWPCWAMKGLAGCVLCVSRNSVGVRRKLLRINHFSVCTLLYSVFNSEDSMGNWIYGNQSSLPICCLHKPRSGLLMRTGRESRLGEGDVLAKAGNHNRKPSAVFAACMRDMCKPCQAQHK